MTKDFAESLAEIIADVSVKHSADIGAGVDEAERRVKRLPDFPDFAGDLIRQALREQIHQYRHKINRQQRYDAGAYGGSAKVISASSRAVNDAARDKCYYDYFIGGTVLGELTGAELPDIAASEEEKAEGCTFNALLCRQLAKVVPDEKRVRDAVTETKLRALFMRLRSKVSPKRAPAESKEANGIPTGKA